MLKYPCWDYLDMLRNHLRPNYFFVMCIWDQINDLLLLLRENCQGMSRLLKLSRLDWFAKTFTFTFISRVLSETKKSCWGSLGLTKGLPWWDILNNWDLFSKKNIGLDCYLYRLLRLPCLLNMQRIYFKRLDILFQEKHLNR